MVEQRPLKPKRVGSNPTTPTMKHRIDIDAEHLSDTHAVVIRAGGKDYREALDNLAAQLNLLRNQFKE